MNELNQMIDMYFDGELDKRSEPVLFSLLSQNPDAREYFKKMNLIKNELGNIIEEFPLELDRKILLTVGAHNQKHKSIFALRNYIVPVTYIVSALLLALSFFFYSKSEEYKVRLIDLTREVNQKDENIYTIMNILREVEVRGSYLKMKPIRVNGERGVISPLIIIMPDVDVNENYIKLKEIKVTPKI
jgi:hypothetical protein